MIEYYKKRASEYENIYQKPERQYFINEYKEYLAVFFTNRSVLELACGTGFWTESISYTAKRIKATDINDTVLDIAKTKNYRNECIIEFEVMDFKNKSEYSSFDGIFIGFLVSHLSKDEFERLIHDLVVTNRNQKILLMDNNYIDGESTKISIKDSLGNTYQIRKLEDGSSYEIMKNFYTEEELNTIMKKYNLDYKINKNKYFWSLEIIT